MINRLGKKEEAAILTFTYPNNNGHLSEKKRMNFFHRLYPLQLSKLIYKSLFKETRDGVNKVSSGSGNGNSSSSAVLLSRDNALAQLKDLLSLYRSCMRTTTSSSEGEIKSVFERTMTTQYGWFPYVAKSKLKKAGNGLFINGHLPQNQIVCIYPGTIYQPWDPILLASIYNTCIIRLSDGSCIDGKSSGLSKWIYNSCSERDGASDHHHPSEMLGRHWIEGKHPLATGQKINNANIKDEANVTYYELLLTKKEIPLEYLFELPNVFFKPMMGDDEASWSMRIVVLVSLRDVGHHQELYSTYMSG